MLAAGSVTHNNAISRNSFGPVSMASPPLTQLPLPAKHTSLPSNKNRLSLNRAHHPFDEIPQRDVVSWTSSIARHCRSGRFSEAASALTHMRLAHVEPNYITFVIILSACGDFPSEASRFGCSIHGYIRKLGIDHDNVVLGTALVGMYAKSARLDSARQAFDEMNVKNSVSWNTMIDGYMRNGEVEAAISLFDSMPKRDKVSWTALISGFVKNGHFEEALECFREMQLADVDADYVTVVAVLNACTNLGALGQGLWTHRYVQQRDFSENMRLSNSLIDMYARCGCINFARQVFNKMPKRSLVSWNSIIVGFAINGHAEDALEHFSLMQKAGFKPDGVSFTGALTACSHAGLINEGLQYYDKMRRVYSISSRIEHYGCMVDLLSRAGRLEDALRVIESMPMKPNEVVVGSLLAACRTHGDVGLAERLMDYLVHLEPDCDSNYVLLSNIYAAVGRWDGVSKVRNTMKDRGISKKPGFSAVEIDCSSHEFVAGDKSHQQSEDIYALLDQLSHELKLYGYVPESIVGAPAVYD
ncbi:pentatricopeptide repeat-containing protein At1g05750, chloroplastic [Magnolia sinica]|uniref:pentatricopeptide repeat-containing protein At1g05750, chloroplastic n=1 Tax=Magnolia sinica TaxID=86752 RepID=UPI0026598F90|nr:pentatricopeptide repeat-containing protein At1g05750, chloroplastic [Magnolia sinica]